jgi:hypothetical protein
MTRVRTAGAPALPFGPDPVQVLQGIPDDFNWLVLHEKPQVNDLGLWCRFFQHNARLKVRATSGRSGSEVLVELIHQRYTCPQNKRSNHSSMRISRRRENNFIRRNLTTT